MLPDLPQGWILLEALPVLRCHISGTLATQHKLLLAHRAYNKEFNEEFNQNP